MFPIRAHRYEGISDDEILALGFSGNAHFIHTAQKHTHHTFYQVYLRTRSEKI